MKQFIVMLFLNFSVRIQEEKGLGTVSQVLLSKYGQRRLYGVYAREERVDVAMSELESRRSGSGPHIVNEGLTGESEAKTFTGGNQTKRVV